MTTVQPITPWKPTKSELMKEAAIFVASLAISFLLVKFTGFEGKLALIVLFFIANGILTAAYNWSRFGSMTAKDSGMKVLVSFGALLTVFPIASILGTLIAKGLPGIKLNLFTQDMSLAAPTDPLTNGGLLHAITGTLTLVAFSLVMSLPIGILTALYLTEIKGVFSRPIRFLVQAMSGVPSIVAGLFILSAVLYPITHAYSGLMGALALTILMIPTIARTSEEVLNLIPNDLREAGVALGGTQWRTVLMIVLPAAKSGLVTAMILGVARIAGETAPLLLLTGGGDTINPNGFSGPIGSLPFYVWKSFNAGTAEATTRAWAGLLVLVFIVLVLFTAARFLGTRKVKS
jgi:phosphate transport system permease protein